MWNAKYLFCVCAVVLFSVPALAAPSSVSYQGELMRNGQIYHGEAGFKFALLTDGGRKTLWSNDGTSREGSQPAGSVPLDVEDGFFSVMLGAPPMDPLTGEAVSGVDEATLRVWVNTGDGFEQLPDQPVGSSIFTILDDVETSFAARSFTSQQITGGVTTVVELETVDFGDWDGNSFTAPQDGVYEFDFRVYWGQSGGATVQFWVYINNSAEVMISNDNDEFGHASASYRFELSEGDVVDLRTYSTDSLYRVCGNSQGGPCLVSGHLVHP